MFQFTVLYPAGEGRTFDMNYYLKSHIPMFQSRMGAVVRNLTVVQGVPGVTGAPAAFAVMAQGIFDSPEAFQAAFAPHAAEIMADVPKYTNIEPIVQFSEVKLPA